MVSTWLRRTGVRRTLFAGVVLLLTASVGWLGWRVLAQEQQKRVDEERETAADLIVADFNQRLSSIERDLEAGLSRDDRPAGLDRSGGVVIRLRDPRQPPAPAFPEAEALAGVAQDAFKRGRFAAALAAYDRIEMFGPVPIGDVVGGIPAGLFAEFGRLKVHERRGDRAGQLAAARALESAINAGRWPVSAPTYQFLHDQVREVVAGGSKADGHPAVVDAVAWLWEQQASEPKFPKSGRASRVFESGSALLVWRSSSDAVAVWIADRRALEEIWVPELKPLMEPRHAHLAVSTPDGQLVLGTSAPPDRPAVRLASVTGLPWTIQITNTGDSQALRDRRRLLIAGMSLVFVLVVAGAWLIERTVARELAVADLQSDFVSAVSHEFRTPLTTLCQLSEMLMRDRVASDNDRREYYRLLNNESHRLRRLVETLLTFGRLDAGRMEFRLTDLDVTALVRNTVDEFSVSRQARQHRIELTADDSPIRTRADGEVLKTVLWNLLENAAKYSPECDTIWVVLKRSGNDLALSVRDGGVGIPVREQRQVFDKFVRGAAARASDVGGVGVGLAMAKRIVEAHGGEIRLDSAPGAGSTFTVTLPLAVPIPELTVQRPAPAVDGVKVG